VIIRGCNRTKVPKQKQASPQPIPVPVRSDFYRRMNRGNEWETLQFNIIHDHGQPTNKRNIIDSEGNSLYAGEVNRNGRPHGNGELYYTDGPFKGQVEFKGKFENGGIKNGTRKFYYWEPNFPNFDDNKNPKADLKYKNGVSTGIGKGYPSLCKWKSHKGEITEDGEITGKGETFYKNGRVVYRGNFVKGRYDDEDGEKYRDKADGRPGRLWYKGGFRHGAYSGKGKTYAKNGHVRYEGGYNSGKYSGEGTKYYVDGPHIGKILQKGTFSDKFERGKSYKYHPNGNKREMEDGFFALNGRVRGGKRKYYGENGQITAKVKIENDKPTDSWTLYKPGKKVWYVGEVDDDINPHGKGTVYYVDRPGVVKVEDASYRHGRLNKGTKVDYHRNGRHKYKVWIDRNSSEKTTGMLYNPDGEKRYYGPITEEGKPQSRGKIYLADGDMVFGEFNDGKFLERSENSARIFAYNGENWVEQLLSNERSPERLPKEKRKREDNNDTTHQDKNDDSPQPPNKKQKTE